MKIPRSEIIAAIILVCFFFLVLPGCFLYAVHARHPPRDARFVRLFQNHRFAGHTKHLGICWHAQPPTNIVATFDRYEGQSSYAHRVVMYRPVESNWYLWTDL